MYKSKEAVRGGGSWCFRILRASLRKRLEGFRFLGVRKGLLWGLGDGTTQAQMGGHTLIGSGTDPLSRSRGGACLRRCLSKYCF